MMKKDIKWLREEIGTEMIQLEPNRKERWSDVKYQTLRSVAQKIDQLDEPELISHELPVIPKYVAEYLEFAKKDASLMQVMETVSVIDGWIAMKKEYDWISENDEAFARAWLDGYTVEEPLYYALIKGHELVNDEGEWSTKYWNLWVSGGCVFPADRLADYDDFLTTMSKEEWSEWGINDTNADFIKVEEVE